MVCNFGPNKLNARAQVFFFKKKICTRRAIFVSNKAQRCQKSSCTQKKKEKSGNNLYYKLYNGILRTLNQKRRNYNALSNSLFNKVFCCCRKNELIFKLDMLVVVMYLLKKCDIFEIHVNVTYILTFFQQVNNKASLKNYL